MDISPDRRAEKGGAAGMMEQYFAIKVYGFYILIALLGILAIVLLALYVADKIKRR